MRFNVDLHTHTVASDHAYSTVLEYVAQAERIGIALLAVTDHGPALPDGPHPWHFHNLNAVPRRLGGVGILRGVEANILPSGELDLEPAQLRRLDIVLAGFHRPCCPPSDPKTHTDLLLRVIRSGLVDVIVHPGQCAFPCDYAAVLACAAEHRVAIEINASSDVNSRAGSTPNCVAIATLAKRIGNVIALGTDAHIATFLGNFAQSEKILAAAGIDDAQVLNTAPARVLDFLESRGHAPLPELREALAPGDSPA